MKAKQFKFRTEARGAHVHVDVFALNSGGNTYQNAGHLVFDEWQWKMFEAMLNSQEAVYERT